MVVALNRLAKTSLAHQASKTVFQTKFTLAAASSGSKLLRTSFSLLSTQESNRLKGREIAVAGPKNSSLNFFQKGNSKSPLSPLEFCQQYAREQESAKMKAYMVKSVLEKGFTLAQLLQFFTCEVLDSQVLQLLLSDDAARELLVKAALTTPKNILLDTIYETISHSKSDIVKYKVALDMIRVMLGGKAKSVYSQEILRWVLLGTSTQYSSKFTKEIFQCLNVAEAEIQIIDEKAIPVFLENSWQNNILSIYQTYFADRKQDCAPIAWILYLGLPLEISLDTELHLVPKFAWDFFLYSIQDSDKRKEVAREIRGFLSDSFPPPALKAAIDEIIPAQKEPAHLPVQKKAGQLRREHDFYNSGC